MEPIEICLVIYQHAMTVGAANADTNDSCVSHNSVSHNLHCSLLCFTHLTASLCFFLAETSKNYKPKSNVSIFCLFFLVPFLLTHHFTITASALLIS